MYCCVFVFCLVPQCWRPLVLNSDNSSTIGLRPSLVPQPSLRHHQAATVGTFQKLSTAMWTSPTALCLLFLLFGLHITTHYFQLIESFSTHDAEFGFLLNWQTQGKLNRSVNLTIHWTVKLAKVTSRWKRVFPQLNDSAEKQAFAAFNLFSTWHK